MKAGCFSGFIGSQDTSTSESCFFSVNDLNKPSSIPGKSMMWVKHWTKSDKVCPSTNKKMQPYFSHGHNLLYFPIALEHPECKHIQIMSISLPRWNLSWEIKGMYRCTRKCNMLHIWNFFCGWKLTWKYIGTGFIWRHFQPFHITAAYGRTPVHYVAAVGYRTGRPGQAEATVSTSDPGSFRSFCFVWKFHQVFNMSK